MMKIEDEIKQLSFQDEYQKLIINQLFTGKWISNLISKQFKPFNVTLQQYNVLRIVRGQKGKPISINSITERMIDKMSNVSRLIDKLKDKGLVEREPNSIDRRQMDIKITDKGMKLLQKAEQQELEMRNNFKTLSPEEARTLNNLLDKLRG